MVTYYVTRANKSTKNWNNIWIALGYDMVMESPVDGRFIAWKWQVAFEVYEY